MLVQKLIGATAKKPQQFIAVSHVNSPYITAYSWSSSGFGAKFANPTTLPTGTGAGVAFTEIK